MSASVAQLVEPAYRSGPQFTQTLGPEVADLCEMAGFGPDPEQRLALDLIFALDRQGKSAAFEFAVVCARQNMKTGLFKQAALGWLFIAEERLITWSAHEFSTTREALRDVAALIEGCRPLARRLKTVRYANDDPSIELTSGQRIKFKARTRTGGRGLTGDKVVLDEAFALTADHMGALLPTLSVRPDPQLMYGSSAGLVGSDVLRGVRDRGRAGSSGRLGYLEWCAPHRPCANENCDHEPGREGCQLDNRDNWRAANPLLGRTRPDGTGLTYEYVEAEREALPPLEFARERLGWWDEPGTAEAFGAGFWEACATEKRPPSQPGGLAIASTMDLAFTCIGGAAVDGRQTHLKPLRHGPGTTWVVEEAKTLQDRYGVPVAIDERGPAAVLIPELERAGVELDVLNMTDVLDACAHLFMLVKDGLARHMNYPELDAAVAGAAKRPVGDRWAWGRKMSTADLSPLEAVTFAASVAAETPADRRIVVFR